MTQTYADFSDVCTKFYDLVINPANVARFVYKSVEKFNPKLALFVGGFFLVAKELQNLGISLTVTDYTDEMVAEGKLRLPGVRVEKADLRDLPFDGEFDTVFVIGRVFTHMLTEEDSSRALRSLHRSLKPGGVTFIDNYENTKIQTTDYFNGRVKVNDPTIEITRDSSTQLLSSQPHIVNWKATYQVMHNGTSKTYNDEMQHRAFSRNEMKRLVEQHGFECSAQGDNFDDTSFFTVATRL